MGHEFESEYRIEDGEVVVEGDIVLGSPSEAIDSDRECRAHDHDKALIASRDLRRWETSTIKVEIENDAFNAAQEAEIRLAIRMWNDLTVVTGITLVEVSNISHRTSGISIRDAFGDSCKTQIGRHVGNTTMRLAPSSLCFTGNGQVVAHELGHALGLFHEQQRSDASDNVTYVDAFTDRNESNFNTVNSRRSDRVGRYDVQSLMQYTTGLFAIKLSQPDGTRARLANIQSLQHWTAWTFGGLTSGGVPLMVVQQNDWAIAPRVGDEFVDLDSVLVWDVNRDGTDDVVTLHESNTSKIRWSSGGRSGWRESIVQPVRNATSLSQLRTGRFTLSPSPWAVQVLGQRRIGFTDTLNPSSAMVSVAIDFDPADLEVANFSGDSADDVLLVAPSGDWFVMEGSLHRSAIPTTLTRVAIGKGRQQVEMVHGLFGGSAAVIGFVNGKLQISTASGSWLNLVPSTISLPSGVNSIDEVTVGHFDSSGVASGAELDVITYQRREFEDEGKRNESIGWPFAILNAGGTSPRASRIAVVAAEMIEMRNGVLIGAFGGPFSDRLGILSGGRIVSTPQWNTAFVGPNFIAPSDAAAIGIYEERSGSSPDVWLTDRYPQSLSSGFPDIHVPLTLSSVDVGEMFSLYAWFMSRTGVRGVTVTVEQRVGTTFVTRSQSTMSFSTDESSGVDFPFAPPSPGVWRVSITPSFPATTLESAVWIFETAPTCGDLVVTGSETCDDGNAQGGDGCSSTCSVEICGNSIVDVAEECDDGNTASLDGCSSSCRVETTALCGNGVIDPGEFCDDGNTVNSDLCRADCRSGCGDGILDVATEQCDDVSLPTPYCDASCLYIFE